MNLAIIARADLTGLGIQSRNWVGLLNPHKIIIINSKPFNGNEQHYEWYKNRKNVFVVNGFIQQNQIMSILDNTDLLLTFEIPYNYQLFSVARQKGIKTILQNNWEFTDYINNPSLPLPDVLMNHSYWHLDEQKRKWPDITEYCPTPLFVQDYEVVKSQNIKRIGKVRFLHIAGRKTYLDRNGTLDLLEAIKLIPRELDFELVIKNQTVDLPEIVDSRVVIVNNQPVDERDLYYDFDAVIMPRRYGGASLPMNESLASGLPVIMTDIDPNNKVLPKSWLVPAAKQTEFMARTIIDVYSADRVALANKIIEFVNMDRTTLSVHQYTASTIANKEYSSTVVKDKFDAIIKKLDN